MNLISDWKKLLRWPYAPKINLQYILLINSVNGDSHFILEKSRKHSGEIRMVEYLKFRESFRLEFDLNESDLFHVISKSVPV